MFMCKTELCHENCFWKSHGDALDVEIGVGIKLFCSCPIVYLMKWVRWVNVIPFHQWSTCKVDHVLKPVTFDGM